MVNTIGMVLWKLTTTSFIIVEPIGVVPVTFKYIPCVMTIGYVNIVWVKSLVLENQLELSDFMLCLDLGLNLF